MNRFAIWITLLVAGAGAAAAPLDPHRIYEEKCGGCHTAHAGDFVWEMLDPAEGGFVGRNSNTSLRAFLEAGHGKLTAGEIEVLLDQFALIHNSGRLFHTKCRICHENAVGLARGDLILKDNRLMGRYTGRDIEVFLQDHGRATPSEITTLIEVLSRALTTQEP